MPQSSRLTTIITLAHRLLSRTRLLTRHLAITSRTMSTFPAVTLNDGHKIPGVGYGCGGSLHPRVAPHVVSLTECGPSMSSGTAWYAAKPDESGANRPLVEAIKSAIKLGLHVHDSSVSHRIAR